MVDRFESRDKRNSLMPEEVARIPWPLCQQYEMIHHWMDKQDPLSALLQLRDTSETLIKLLATLFLAYDLRKAQKGEELDKDCPIFWFVQEEGLPLGIWNQQIFIHYKERCNNPMVDTFFQVMSNSEKRYWKQDTFSLFVEARNKLAHGILSQDRSKYYEEAQEWLKQLDGCLQNVLSFFSAIILFTESPVQPADDTNAVYKPTLDWTADNFSFDKEISSYPFHLHETADSNLIYPVYVRLQDESLSLSPILSVQSCKTCQEISTFFLHQYKPNKKTTNAKFLEFLVKGIQSEKKAELLSKLVPTIPPTFIAKIQSKRHQNAQSLQEDDAQYVPVDYLIEQVEKYIVHNDQGIIILKGDSGVGKTWFCKNLERVFKKVFCVYIHLQYQCNIGSICESIKIACTPKKWNFSLNSLPSNQIFFAAILQAVKNNCPNKSLVLILDGWNELPEDEALLNCLHCPTQHLPKGCFVLISHRPGMKQKNKDSLSNILQYSTVCCLEMWPDKMIEILKTYITNQGLGQYKQTILEKSQRIFLYVYHYCHLLEQMPQTTGDFPDIKELYTKFFERLKERVGPTLYNKIYVPILSMLAITRVPLSIDQLSVWSEISDANAEFVLQDVKHLLECTNMTYSIRHQEILDFFREQTEWQQACRTQEEAILSHNQSELAQDDKDEALYAIRYALTHWLHLACNNKKDLHATEKICRFTDLEKQLLRWMEKLGEEFPEQAKTYLDLGDGYYLQQQYQKALDCYQKSLEIQKNKLGADSMELVPIYNKMAEAHEHLGQHEQAKECTNQANNITTKQRKDAP